VPLSILSAQCCRGQGRFTRPAYRASLAFQVYRPARIAPPPRPLSSIDSPSSPPNPSYAEFSLYVRLVVFDCSNSLPTRTRHKRLLGCHPASQQGAFAAPRFGRVSIVYVRSIAVFHLAYVSQAILGLSFRTPRPIACTFETFISDAEGRLRLTVRSLVPRLRSIAYCRSLHAPQGGFPHRQRAGCPRVALIARF